tara:strand:- start:4760 stop:7369 length:2610 start_codon:yes stop_codon:yes gene_type:complete
MALQKEQKLTSYQERIGVNNGSGFGDLAQASNREANNFDVIGNALSNKLLNLGQQIGAKEGETAAQTYNMKRGTRTVTDENGIEKEIDIVEPITAPKGLRTASQIEAFDTIMVKRYTKEVFSTLELETKKIYNDVKRNNGTAQDFESLIQPMFNAINENIPTNIQQAVTDYSDNLLISYGADIDEIHKNKQYDADLATFKAELTNDGNIELNKIADGAYDDQSLNNLIEDYILGIQSGFISEADLTAFKATVKKEKYYYHITSSIKPTVENLQTLQILLEESGINTATFDLKNGKQGSINKEDFYKSGIDQTFLDNKNIRISKLTSDINSLQASNNIIDLVKSNSKALSQLSGTEKKIALNAYLDTNPDADNTTIENYMLHTLEMLPEDVLKNFNLIGKSFDSYNNVLNSGFSDNLKDTYVIDPNGDVTENPIIYKLGLNDSAINEFLLLEKTRESLNLAPDEAWKLVQASKKNPKAIKDIGLDESWLRNNIASEVNKLGEKIGFFNDDTVSGFGLKNEIYEIISLQISNMEFGNDPDDAKDLIRDKIKHYANNGGGGGQYGSDDFTVEPFTLNADKAIVLHPITQSHGITKYKIVAGDVQRTSNLMTILPDDIQNQNRKITEVTNNVDYLIPIIETKIKNSEEFTTGDLSIYKDSQLKVGKNIKVHTISTAGAKNPIYQIVYVTNEGEVIPLHSENGNLLTLAPKSPNEVGAVNGSSPFKVAQDEQDKIRDGFLESGYDPNFKANNLKEEIKLKTDAGIANRQAYEETIMKIAKKYKNKEELTFAQMDMYTKYLKNSHYLEGNVTRGEKILKSLGVIKNSTKGFWQNLGPESNGVLKLDDDFTDIDLKRYLESGGIALPNYARIDEED